VCTILFALILFICLSYSASKDNYENTLIAQILRIVLNILRWILFGPFMETFIATFKCKDGYHKTFESTPCFSGLHIAFSIFSILFSLLLLFFVFLATSLFAIKHTGKEDAEGKINSQTEVILLIFRLAVIIFISFNHDVFSS